MKKIMLVFISIIVFVAFFQISLGWDQDKVFDGPLENAGINYREDEVIDILTPYLLNSDNGKAEVRFIINSNQVIKIDMYMWEGGIQNTTRVHVDPNSTKYKRLISKIMEIIVKNSNNRNF